jgi:quercetin dioxygenase-like cupin family protein
MMGVLVFYKTDPSGFKEVLDGVRYKTLVYGEKTLFAEFHLDRGSTVPVHNHPYEQTGYLVSGKLRFDVEGEKIEAEPGNSWCIPSDVKHGAEVLEDSVVIEVFSPVRKDYLP